MVMTRWRGRWRGCNTWLLRESKSHSVSSFHIRSLCAASMGTRVIDPAGDLILNCSGATFLASSKALCLASSYFRSYTSVTLVVAKDRSQLPVLIIPEDPVSFCIFLNVVHQCPATLRCRYTHHTLQKLAGLVGKYKSSAVMVAYGREWLQQDLDALSPEDLWKLLQFAYAVTRQDKLEAIASRLI
ncbi:hypothetical protein BDV12DRAFT_108811 [Aspergillus spectabilis]